jgi:hypothetical protein
MLTVHQVQTDWAAVVAAQAATVLQTLSLVVPVATVS